MTHDCRQDSNIIQAASFTRLSGVYVFVVLFTFYKGVVRSVFNVKNNTLCVV